jgi:hypothetical protein
MPQMIHRATDPQVFVDASTIDLVDESLVAEFEPDWTINGLMDVSPEGGAVKILCGQEIATVTVIAELWDGPPPLDSESWQDAAEMSVAWTNTTMDFATTATDENGPDVLHLPGPGDYRVRVHGRNRDEHDPIETYLIQVWPAPHDKPALHKATSQTGEMWRE